MHEVVKVEETGPQVVFRLCGQGESSFTNHFMLHHLHSHTRGVIIYLDWQKQGPSSRQSLPHTFWESMLPSSLHGWPPPKMVGSTPKKPVWVAPTGRWTESKTSIYASSHWSFFPGTGLQIFITQHMQRKWDQTKKHIEIYPNTPCMQYMPTLTPKTTPM